MPEHKTITDPEIHEPKGVAAAAADRAYISDGAGSGSWQAVVLPGDFISSRYGAMEVVQNASSQTLTAAVDATLYTGTDYQKLNVGWGAGLAAGGTVTFNADKLDISESGTYLIDVQVSLLTATLVTTPLFALKFSYGNSNATLDNSRAVYLGGAEEATINLSKVRNITAGQSISLWGASVDGGAYTIRDAQVSAMRIG